MDFGLCSLLLLAVLSTYLFIIHYLCKRFSVKGIRDVLVPYMELIYGD